MPKSARKRTPTEIELAVLDQSRRRCTLCFHLEGDMREKHGQIAHLDQDPSNFAEDNLSFMCLAHHSLYDSKTSQHKNYTMSEVKAARDRLYTLIESGDHLQTIAPTQSNVVRADQRTLDEILSLMKEAPAQFLQFHAFVERFSWSRVEGLVTIVIHRREPQHEFIDTDLEALRHSFIARAAFLLSMLQITMHAIPETPEFCSVTPYERERFPKIYLDTLSNLEKRRVETWEAYQALIRAARKRLV
jgi:hypothetical protein